VDPVETHYFSENLAGSGIEPGTSRSVARNSEHYTTEAVLSIVNRVVDFARCSRVAYIVRKSLLWPDMVTES
jgi:hypothetical protein